ncbi:MAG: DbpA RNA binding domain-containing protein [Gemmatimonadetes bacterium]|nr:DbpA RNA binding domain-containing protein [Gemmatimonadota bacterium]
MEQDLRDEGAARARHVVHVLPFDDVRLQDVVRTLVERYATEEDAEPITELKLLVLVPTAAEAAHLAATVNEGLDPSSPLLVPVTDALRGARRLEASAVAAITTPDLAQALVRKSLLKLDTLATVACLELDVLIAQMSSALEGVMGELPKGTESVASTGVITAAVTEYLDRHARKARQMTYDLASPSDAIVEYVVVDVAQRTRALSHLLSTLDPAHATLVAAETDAEAACASLAQLGYGPDDALVSFSEGECPKGEPLVVLYTAPADPGDLAELVALEPQRVVALVAPEEAAAFRRVFGKGARPATLPGAVSVAIGASADQVAGVRTELAAGGLHHHLVTLSPLFAEFDAAEVAAALLRMAERTAIPAATPVMSMAPSAESARPRRTATTGAAPAAAPARAPSAPTGAFTSLFITVGEKDGARKGDLVGAISNEAGISSELLGKINMRDTFTVVEVDSSVAARVIETLNGKTIRGRVVAVREDRGSERPDGGGDRPRRSSFGSGAGARGGAGSRGGAGARGGATRGGDRPRRSFRDDGPRAGGSSGGFGGARGGRPTRDGDRPRRPSRDDVGGPRTFRDGDRNRAPRAMDESREWKERGERLKHTRRPRRDD